MDTLAHVFLDTQDRHVVSTLMSVFQRLVSMEIARQVITMHKI